ncbi:hypothetical protein IV203_020912 [Nitzschia inconspicua]|uniref:DOMON domain-containing protein n=1 Tax=Nitzschia inconspicua TaxID=303405 RepID=A0A9K3KGA9_9STRA|nr:hypothetical protein IV203_020912 [Nitzschia inconspicua]
MRKARQFACAVLLLSTWTLSTSSAQEWLSDCALSDPYSLDDNGFVTLQHYLNPYEGTFTMRVTYNQAHTWIGVGMNLENGNSHTSSSYAVIGSVQEDVDGDSSYVGEAYRYFMDSTASDGSGVTRLLDVPGHLKRSVFVQNPANQEGDTITVLEFTHDLVIRNDNNVDEILYQIAVPSPSQQNGGEGDFEDGNGESDGSGEPDRNGGRRKLQQSTRFIWAVGLPTNQWAGAHQLHGSFTLEELPSLSFCVDIFTNAPSETPTTETYRISNGVFSTQSENNDGSDGNDFAGGDIDALGDDFLDDDLARAGSELQDPVAHIWLYHGVFMGLAWGVFAPIAIFIPLLRKLDFMEFDDRWKSIHFLSSLTTVVLSAAGFALAVMAANPVYSINGEKEKQYFTGNMHVAMGVIIVVVMVMQALMGCCIPSDQTDDDDDYDDSSWDSEIESDSEDDRKEKNDDTKSKRSSGPLHTMMIDNKTVNEEGQLVPNRTAYKQYIPKRLTFAVQERAKNRAEATTILGSAVGSGVEHQVANLTPRKTEAKSHRLEAIEVVDLPDVTFVSKMNEEAEKNDAQVPTTLTSIQSDDVSELEDPAPPKETSGTLREKSDFLICWIYTHRLLGLVLFALALYTCHTGLVLQSEMTADSEEEMPTHWTKQVMLLIFWGVTCGIIVLILLVRFIYPCLQDMYRGQEEANRSTPIKSNISLNSSKTYSKGSRSGNAFEKCEC